MQEDVLQRVKQILNERFKNNVSLMAREIGVEQNTLNNYVVGKRKPSLELAMAILRTFGDISAEWLMRGTGTMTNGAEGVEKPMMTNSQIISTIDFVDTMTAQVKSLREENMMLKEQLAKTAQNRKKA